MFLLIRQRRHIHVNVLLNIKKSIGLWNRVVVGIVKNIELKESFLFFSYFGAKMPIFSLFLGHCLSYFLNVICHLTPSNYWVIAWGNTYRTTLQPLFIREKKAFRIITFTSFNEHTSPLFKDLNVVKVLYDYPSTSRHKFHKKLLPPVFDPYFNSVRKTHIYDTRLSSKMTYSMLFPKPEKNMESSM